jgi:hypothetical protein
MGFLTDLLLLPIMGPVKGLAFIAEQIQEAAEAGLLDEDQIQAELMTLEMRRATGEVSDEEYEEYQATLLEYLEAMRQYREYEQNPDAVDDES